MTRGINLITFLSDVYSACQHDKEQMMMSLALKFVF